MQCFTQLDCLGTGSTATNFTTCCLGPCLSYNTGGPCQTCIGETRAYLRIHDIIIIMIIIISNNSNNNNYNNIDNNINYVVVIIHNETIIIIILVLLIVIDIF